MCALMFSGHLGFSLRLSSNFLHDFTQSHMSLGLFSHLPDEEAHLPDELETL